MSTEADKAEYTDPRTNERVPLQTPIWRSLSGNPLMLTPLPDIQRDDVDLSTRSIWRYRAALPVHASFQAGTEDYVACKFETTMA